MAFSGSRMGLKVHHQYYTIAPPRQVLLSGRVRNPHTLLHSLVVQVHNDG